MVHRSHLFGNKVCRLNWLCHMFLIHYKETANKNYLFGSRSKLVMLCDFDSFKRTSS